MIAFPPAKINLGLYVLAKRPDGYHDIATCFYPVPWQDALELVEAADTSLTTSGLQIPGDPEDNLVMKAYRMLAKDFELPSVAFHLLKHIPFGAGLGGGSADGAYALRLLNRAFDLGLGIAELSAYAARLGSDCAFFIEEKPMIGTGRGEQLSPMSLSLRGYYACIAWPGFGVPTREAYAGVSPQQMAEPLEALLSSPVSEWRERLENQFSASVMAKYPEIGQLRQKMYDAGAIYAEMSGSGAAVFGIFAQATALDFPPHYRWWAGILTH